MLVLKRRKYQETLLEKNQKLLDNIQEMVDSIQFAQMEVKVFNSLKQGASTLKELHAQIDLGELEDIMTDTAEAIEKQKVGIVYLYYTIIILFIELFRKLMQC